MSLSPRSLVLVALCSLVSAAIPARSQSLQPILPTAPLQAMDRVEHGAGNQSVEPPATDDGGAAEKADKAAYIAMYDDGAWDYLLSSGSTTVETNMLFQHIGGSDVTLGGVDFCWRRTGADSKIRYEVVIWAADGPGGTPGTELAKFAAVATGVSNTPAFYHTSFNYPLTTTNVYIGVRYNPAVDQQFWFCVDDDGLGGVTLAHPGYFRNNESGSWSHLSTFGAGISYDALMVRAYVFTPGVFAEVLGVPYFLVDTSSGAGTTTLFAVRNLTGSPVSADVEYYTTGGASQRTDTLNLAPYDTQTVNIRDVSGLVYGMDGFERGFVLITTAGNPDMSPVLAGDYFQVDVGNNFATGDKLFRMIQLCDIASVRSLKFPLPGSGTQLKVWISNPRGTGAGDPASFIVQPYDEDGNAVGAATPVKTTLYALDFDASVFTGLSFATLRFDFTNSGGGVVYAEASTQGRFSVGVSGQCDEFP